MAAFCALAGKSQPGVPSLLVLPAMHTGDELQVVNIPGPAVKEGETIAPYKGKSGWLLHVLTETAFSPGTVDSHVCSGCRTHTSRRQASLCLLAVEATWGGEGISSRAAQRLESCRLRQGRVHLWVPFSPCGASPYDVYSSAAGTQPGRGAKCLRILLLSALLAVPSFPEDSSICRCLPMSQKHAGVALADLAERFQP